MFYEYQGTGASSLVNPPENLHQAKYGGHANNPLKSIHFVETTTIEEIMNQFNIEQFEMVKMNVEGSEYEILEYFPKMCAKQISISFHEFLGLNPYEDIEDYHTNVLPKLLPGYTLVYDNKGKLTRNQNNQKDPNALCREDSLYVLNDLVL